MYISALFCINTGGQSRTKVREIKDDIKTPVFKRKQALFGAVDGNRTREPRPYQGRALPPEPRQHIEFF